MPLDFMKPTYKKKVHSAFYFLLAASLKSKDFNLIFKMIYKYMSLLLTIALA